MKKDKSTKVVFKAYQQHQMMLLPPSLDELIPEKHVVRVISAFIDKMDLDPIVKSYKGGGTSSYHPMMLLKVLVYAYTERIYSSRRIAKALRENINFMWLSGNNQPNFRTINRFRSSRLKGTIEEVFASIIALLIEEGYINFDRYFVDGTKIEANANKYSYVWRKSTQRYKAQLKAKIQELLHEIDQANEQENQEYGNQDLEELGDDSTLTSEKLSETVEKLNEKLAHSPENKKLKRVIKKLTTEALPRLQKYEEQEERLDGRNSYSKTDPDATFMRMKESHLNQGELKPAFNIQIGTENQFILGYSAHQTTADAVCLKPHLEKLHQQTGRMPKSINGDSAYGSEENYDYIAKHNIGNYLKYNTFHLEQKRAFQNDEFRTENLRYDDDKDEFVCPAGVKLKYQGTKPNKTGNGYISQRRIYKAESCSGCQLRERCHKSEEDRQIRISFRLKKFKEQARQNLFSEKGRELRSRRGIEVESVFGHIKHNRGFRRFMLRGLDKVNIEFGLLSIAHNMLKVAA